MAMNFLLKRSGAPDKRPDPTSMALGELDLNYDAVTGGVFYKDSNGGVVKVGSAQVSATAPNATPAGSAGNSTGEFWYDTANSALNVWDGSAWAEVGGGGGVTQIIAGTNVTVTPSDGLGAVTVNATSPWTTASGTVLDGQTTAIYTAAVNPADVFAGWGFLSVNSGVDVIATYQLQITQIRASFPPGPAGPAPIITQTLYYKSFTAPEPAPTVTVAWDLNGPGGAMLLNVTATNGNFDYQLTFNRTT